MNGNETFRHSRTQDDVCHSICCNDDWCPWTWRSNFVSCWHVAVCAGGQTSLKWLTQIDAELSIEDDECAITARECNLIAAIVPPVLNAGTESCVSELNHACNLWPSMFANPSVVTLTVSVESWCNNVASSVPWWSHIAIFERKWTHQTWNAVGPSKVERGCHFVQATVLVSQNVSIALVIAVKLKL